MEKLLEKVNRLVRMGFYRKGIMDLLIRAVRFIRLKVLKTYGLVLMFFGPRIKFNRMSLSIFKN